MAPWARGLVMATVVLWTGLTAALGVIAVQAERAPEPPPGGRLALYDVAAPGDEPEVRWALVDAPEVTPAPAPPSRPSVRRSDTVHAVPKWAEPVGALPNARPADVDRRPDAPPRKASRGVIVLDPGHGRGDPGAVHYLPDGTWDITEAESNLRGAELLRDELVAIGYDVYLTREGEGQGPGRPLPLQFIASDLYWRVGLARAVDADVFVSIHGNGATNRSISGVETWYCGRHRHGAANHLLAALVQQAMMDALHEYGYFPPDRGLKEDAATHHAGGFCQFVVTRETEVPAVLIEFLFLSNDDDARVLLDPRTHELMAQHVARAIDAFMHEHGGRR
jgi:N-acetylmuramoyl-L-alanine amidase